MGAAPARPDDSTRPRGRPAGDARTITGLVDGLVATGFVTRQADPTDRRATLVEFTEHGTAVVEDLEHGHRDLADALFAGIPAQDLERFVAVLDHVLERFQTRLAASTADAA